VREALTSDGDLERLHIGLPGLRKRLVPKTGEVAGICIRLGR
jgi:hypothetical protein